MLVSNLLSPTLRALPFAQATSPESLRAVKVSDAGEDDPLVAEWQQRGVPVPLVVIESQLRETVRPIRRYLRSLAREHPGDVVSVIIPEYVVSHWFEPSVTVTSVPWVLADESPKAPA